MAYQCNYVDLTEIVSSREKAEVLFSGTVQIDTLPSIFWSADRQIRRFGGQAVIFADLIVEVYLMVDTGCRVASCSSSGQVDLQQTNCVEAETHRLFH